MTMTSDSRENPQSELDAMHHIAISVENIQETIDWYTKRFRCRVRYRDDSWALLEFRNISLAFVSHGQHPPHIGFVREDAETFGELRPHRDGTRSVYIEDPAGNAVELLKLK